VVKFAAKWVGKFGRNKHDPETGMSRDYGEVYVIAECPACNQVNVLRYGWHDGMDNEDEIDYEVLFPHETRYPLGLPEKILSAFKAAEKVKTIDVNAYAILMRRLLEMVCLERNATRGTLASMLKELSDKNEIPSKLVDVAKGMREFGNIGAHAGSGELSEDEIPIVSALCIAVLEYIYSAPYLASVAEKKLNQIKSKNK